MSPLTNPGAVQCAASHSVRCSRFTCLQAWKGSPGHGRLTVVRSHLRGVHRGRAGRQAASARRGRLAARQRQPGVQASAVAGRGRGAGAADVDGEDAVRLVSPALDLSELLDKFVLYHPQRRDPFGLGTGRRGRDGVIPWRAGARTGASLSFPAREKRGAGGGSRTRTT